jgi:hypothetical protein
MSSFFYLDDGTYASSSWSYDDGFMQLGSRVSLFPADDIPDDSGAWPADTAPPDEPEDDGFDETTPLIEDETPLSDPPSVTLCAAFGEDLVASYYKENPPFATVVQLRDPVICEMGSPVPRRPEIRMPIWEVGGIPMTPESS